MTSRKSSLNTANTHISHIACPDCDLLLSIPPLLPNEVAHCIRCDATLFKQHKNSTDRALAFAITGLLLFIISNLFPLLSLKALGTIQESSLLSTAMALFQADHILLSGVILLTTFIFPATTLLGTIYVLIQVKMKRINRYTAPIFRFLRSTDAWGMLEIFMLAILVAVVKLGDIADIVYGVSLYAFCLLILSLSLMSYSLNPHDVWNQLRNDTGRQ
jgi:paraquat-inducible protein A